MMLFTLSATAIQSSIRGTAPLRDTASDRPAYMYMPPLTASTCPVIYDASSDARKQTAAATSSGVPEPLERNPRRPVLLRAAR